MQPPAIYNRPAVLPAGAVPPGTTTPAMPAPVVQSASGVPQSADAAKPAPPSNEPLAGENVMNVVMVGAECAPWSKTGELAVPREGG
jgi:hypothetical protein